MVVKNIYNAGHFIGMTYRVKDTNPANYKEDEVRKDIIKMAATIESIIKISPKYVRLYATKEKDYKTEKLLRELGFVIVGYNLDSQDYSKQEATGPNSIQEVYSKAFKNYKEQFDTKGAFIALNYDLPFTGSLVAVPNVINTVNKEGYTMVRLDGCLDDTKPYKKSNYIYSDLKLCFFFLLTTFLFPSNSC
jgi:peptidoglycan/xylan/chitin deacetylase (PgdA/CDA1 family)